jgi:DNA-binding transcriptional ArsR family regulator
MNMKKQTIPQISEKIASPIEAIASPQRIAILLAIGHGEACVCHRSCTRMEAGIYLSAFNGVA